MESSPVVVIGGGFAGLAAAVELAASGLSVSLLEAKARLGGRAYSMFDEELGSWVDNGQHAMMGCYRATLSFLERIGASDRLVRQERMDVQFFDRSGARSQLRAPSLPSPVHAAAAILRFSALSLTERLQALSAGLRWLQWRRQRVPWLRFATVADLLDLARQSQRARRYLWHPITVATLNEEPARAAAEPFVEVLARAFFGSPADSQFVFPRVGLSDLYVERALAFLQEHGATVVPRAVAAEIVLRSERAVAVRTRDGRTFPAGAVVCATHPASAGGLLGYPEWANVFSYSPIVSVHYAYDGPLSLPPFAGLIGTRAQWLFYRPALTGNGSGGRGSNGNLTTAAAAPPAILSVVISAAYEEAEWSNERIADTVRAELEALVPSLRRVALRGVRVIREKRATISLTPTAHRLRPGGRTPYPNVFLAGDWVATGLPATIEGAVVAGKKAAEAVRESLRLGYKEVG